MPVTQVSVEGFNGGECILAGDGEGDMGAFLAPDPLGLYDAPVETIRNSHAFQVGSDFGGLRNLERVVDIGVLIDNSNGSSWMENDSEFRKLWSYTKDSKLWIETEDTRRYLKVRLRQQPDFKSRFDPNQTQIETVDLSLVAGDPWWYDAEDATDTWVSTVDTSNGSTTTGSVTVSNPTDNPIWLKWMIQGPGKPTLPDFSFGDDRFERAGIDSDRQIVMPQLISVVESGVTVYENVRVDTDEQAVSGQCVSSLDTAYYMRMNGVTFCYPLPAYTGELELPVAMSRAPAGVGIQVRCPRPWSRPWGMF